MTTKTETLPRFEIRPLTEIEGDGYLLEFPGYPGCVADAETLKAAIEEGRDALKSYLATLAELRRAEREGVSLNMLATTLLAEGLGRRIGE